MSDRSYLNWPFFAPNHRELADDLSDWCSNQQFRHPNKAADNVDDICRELVADLGAAGWLRHCVPAAWGGVSDTLDVRSIALCRETLGYHSGLADFALAMQGLGSGAISLAGSDAQRQAWLPSVASGDSIAAFALSEPDAGSDVAAMATTATRQGDHYLLSGQKTWISNGGIADFYCVFAKTAPDEGSRGISAFIVDASAQGLEITERLDVIAPHPLAKLTFNDCMVPADALIGSEGDGFKIAMATLDVFRTTVAAAALGFARRAMDEAVERTNTRQMFGAPLSAMQITEASVADMALDIDASALLVYRSAWTKDHYKGRVTREAAMAKLYSTEAAQKIIDRSVQLFGGLGVQSGNIAESLYREIRALRIYEGASEVQKVIIGKQTYAEHRFKKISTAAH